MQKARTARQLTFIRIFAFLAALHAAGCSSDDAIPAEVDSGFEFRDDAFAFANFAHNDSGFDLTPDLVARMCGVELACDNDALPCLPTETAAAFTARVNQTLYEGRSEGFAVLSQLLSLGKLEASDFGAGSAAELTLAGNAKLQAELAYWAATQSVPSALEGDKHFSAKNVMPFLAKALSRDDERYRLAIAIKTEAGFERGHAMVPIGYYRVNHEGLYHLRVYDSNFPASERELQIDTKKNTWRYEVPLSEGESLVYEGTADNGNQLYFSAVTPRTEKLVCPFDEASHLASAATAGQIQALIGYGDAEGAGFEDGKLVERGDSRVAPAFANCPTCNPSSGILNFTVPSKPTEDLSVVLSGGIAMDTAKASTGAEVNVTTPGTSTTVKGIKGDPTKKDQLIVKKDGGVTYDSDSGSEVELTHVVKNGKKEQSVTVTIKAPDGTTLKTTSVSVSVDASGRYSVDTTGFAKGTTIDLTYTSTDGAGMKITTTASVTSTGSPDSVKFAADTGEVFSKQTSCSNGMLDKGFELGVDCGDSCPAKCQIGESCNTIKDCAVPVDSLGYAETGAVFCAGPEGMKKCTAKGCMDGIWNLWESDVDCGDWYIGTRSTGASMACMPCKGSNAATPLKCFDGGDCDTKICAGGGCRAPNPVYLKPKGTMAGQTLTLAVNLDGVQSTRTVMLDGTTDRIKIGEAYNYALSVSAHPTGRYCGFDAASGPRVLSASGHTGYDAGTSAVEREVAMTCSEAAGAIDIDTTGLPGGMVQIDAGVDGKTQLLSISQNGRTSVSAAGRYTLRVTTQPGQMLVDGVQKYVNCFFQNVGGRSYNNYDEGTIEPGTRYTVALACTAHTCPGYSACQGDLRQTITGLPSGVQVGVKLTWKTMAATTTNYSANGTTILASGSGGYTLEVPTQPGDVGAQGSQTHVECYWDGGVSTKSGSVLQATVTETLTCTANVCPHSTCIGRLSETVTGLPSGAEVELQNTLAGTTTTQKFTSDATVVVGEKKGSYSLSVSKQPGFTTIGGKQNFVKCAWSDASTTVSGTIDSTDVAQTLTCTATQCPAPECAVSCTVDSDCPNQNCECGASSGNCTGQSGKCGEAKGVFPTPTTDGATASGTFTVPTGCTQVYVQAWGAAGGTGEAYSIISGPTYGFGGGAGGFVSGYLSVTPGDTLTVWVGQGGTSAGDTGPGGTPSMGSNAGTLASGGAGDGDKWMEDGGGGGGGGATSIQQTGSTALSIVIPGGGGGTVGQAGNDASSSATSSESSSAGGAAALASAAAGGGGGALGGAGGQGYQEAGQPGTYSTLPVGLSATDGSFGTPANTSAPDYDLCVGTSAGTVKAGASGGMFNSYGGDGCVVLRCKGL